MQVDPLVSLLVGALGAALIGLLGAWIQAKRDHRRWLRQRRYDAYHAFMVDMEALRDATTLARAGLAGSRRRNRLKSLQVSRSRSLEAVSILGPRSVNDAGQRWVWVAHHFQFAAEQRNNESWRDARWSFLKAVGRELKSNNVSHSPPARPSAADH